MIILIKRLSSPNNILFINLKINNNILSLFYYNNIEIA